MFRPLLAALMLVSALSAQAPDWTTPAERSNYRTTPRYDETMAYFRRVEQAAPKQVRIEEFGKTGEGRPLLIAVVSKDGKFDPEALKKQGRPIVLIQNAIHAGEMDGKDASMALLRDIVITKKRAALIDKAVLVIIPIYNADGHERVSRYNRINQNGPEEMGWRTTATNLNLNRDYMKADAPETRAWLQLFNRWLPDYFVDNHVTDGADYQYDTTLGVDTGPDVMPSIAEFQKRALAHMCDVVNKAGNVCGPFINLVDDKDPSKGFSIGQDPPRLSTGYVLLQNRPALLVEMHMMKDYRTRVLGNYWTMVGLLEVINREAEALVRMNRANDEAQIKAAQEGGKVALKVEATGKTEPFQYKGYKWNISDSEISGDKRIEYTNEPIEITVPRQSELKVTQEVEIPGVYFIPGQWTKVIEVLKAHGIQMKPLSKAAMMSVDTWRCTGMRWQEKPFESHHLVSWGGINPPDCKRVDAKIDFPPGSVLVTTGQRAAKVIVHLLEPLAPDSFVSWGFFDAVFEQKEYAEHYVAEKLAREMIKDLEVKAEFEKRLAEDKAFAASPSARLNFFYQRSPYWDQRLGLYPVGSWKNMKDEFVVWPVSNVKRP